MFPELPVITLDTIRRALILPDFDADAAQLAMSPRPRPFRRPDMPGMPRLAAVMILLYESHESADGLCFALMRRPEYPGVHSGQISLPGGSRENDETFSQTALRELCEEFGVCDGVEILGALTPLYVPPSDFEIHPIVGALATRVPFAPDPVEVAQILEVPLTMLFDPALKRSETVIRAEFAAPMEIYYYAIADYKVWGATAAILSELEQRLRLVLV